MPVNFFLEEPTRRLRAPWRIILFLLGVILLQVFLSVVYFGVLALQTGDLEAAQARITAPNADLAGQMVIGIPAFFGVLLLTWLCRRYLDRRSFASLGLAPPQRGWPWTVAVGLLTGFLAVAVMVALHFALGSYRYTGVSAGVSTALLIPILLAAAFTEELIMRGYVMQNLREAHGPWIAAVVSSILFWIFHALNPSAWESPLVAVNLFGAGMVLALACLASDDLWLPTGVHFAWNATQGVVFELPISGLETNGVIDVASTGVLPQWLTGGAFGFEGSLLATLSELVLIVFFYRMWQQRQALLGLPRLAV